jgi:hypothetical protein
MGRDMGPRPALEPFLERMPWLAEVGRARLEQIDRREWHMPSEALLARLHCIGELAGANLMFYRREVEAISGGLCTMIAAAVLTAERIDQIMTAEAENPECFVVAYARPVRWLPAVAEAAAR